MKNKNRDYLVSGIVIAVLIIAIVLISVFPKQENNDEIKIGVVVPLTGKLAKHGEWMKNGLELAKEDINNNGGINGKKIKLIYEDTKCLPTDTQTALIKLSNVDNILGYIGPFCGSPTFVAAEFSEKNNIIGITPYANYGKLSDNFFSTNALLEKEGQKIAKFSYDELGLKKIGIFYFNNDWGVFLKDEFKTVFEENGGSIVAIEKVNSFLQDDFRTELLKIKNAGSEGIFILLTNPIIVKQAREIGFTGILLSQNTIQNPDYNVLTDEIIYYSYPDDKSISENLNGFTSRYLDAYGEVPGVIPYDSYDSLIIMTDSIRFCEDKNQELHKCMREYILSNSFEGVSGNITIDKDNYGVTSKEYIIKTLKNGEFVSYQ